MNPEHKELAEKVIDFFKKSDKSKLIPATDIGHLLPDNTISEKVIYPLQKDFGLIERCGKYSFRLTDKGWDFTSFADFDKNLQQEKDFKQLEFDLAKSNIKANKLNEKVAKRNKRETIINIIIGLINIGILIWQSLLIVKSSK